MKGNHNTAYNSCMQSGALVSNCSRYFWLVPELESLSFLLALVRAWYFLSALNSLSLKIITVHNMLKNSCSKLWQNYSYCRSIGYRENMIELEDSSSTHTAVSSWAKFSQARMYTTRDRERERETGT